MTASRRRVSVLFTPAEIDAVRVEASLAVVVDVLRSTTVIPVALAAGATACVPAPSVQEARSMRDKMPGTLLCGEQDGRAPLGFDLGNSPYEYTPDRVGGRALVFTSTNGVPALLRVRSARQVLTGAFVNESAVCDVLHRRSEDVLVIAAGKDRRPALEDVACCGSLAARLLASNSDLALDDGAQMAIAVWKAWEHDLAGLLATSSHGAWLASCGWASDLEFCARRDVVPIVARFANDRLIAEAVSSC